MNQIEIFLEEKEDQLSEIFEIGTFGILSDDEIKENELVHELTKLINECDLTIFDLARILELRDIPNFILEIINERFDVITNRSDLDFIDIVRLITIDDLPDSVIQRINNYLDKLLIKKNYFELCSLSIEHNVSPKNLIKIINNRYNNWTNEEKDLLISFVRNNITQFYEFSTFPELFQNDRYFLISITKIYWDMDEDEQQIFNEKIIELGYSRDIDFIIDTMKYDDGSMAIELADTSLLETKIFWIKLTKAWYDSPREIKLTTDDYGVNYDIIPQHFKDDVQFNQELITLIPGFQCVISPDILIKINQKKPFNLSTLKNIKWGILLILVSLLIYYFYPTKTIPKNCKIDRLEVIKSERLLLAYSNNQFVISYKIALGMCPKGDKEFEFDNKTPEGQYIINSKSENSQYYKNLGISYPSSDDIKNAKSKGKNPGGQIKIHGIMNGFGWIGRFHRWSDWTAGCIALTNEEIDELFNSVKIGSSIEIKP